MNDFPFDHDSGKAMNRHRSNAQAEAGLKHRQAMSDFETNPVGTAAELERLRKDAKRYQFLRDADNWPEGTDAWDALMEAAGGSFDAILDRVIREQGDG